MRASTCPRLRLQTDVCHFAVFFVIRSGTDYRLVFITLQSAVFFVILLGTSPRPQGIVAKLSAGVGG